MRLLERYLLRFFIGPFFSCLLIFILLFVVIDLFSNLADILKENLPPAIILKYYFTFLPIVFVQSSPYAVLLATIYALGLLNRHQEIIAMQAAGISLLRILRPLIFFGLLISLASFYVSEKLVPQALIVSQVIKEENLEKNRDLPKKPQVLYDVGLYGTDGRLFHINKYEHDKKILYGVTVLEHDSHQRVKAKISAQRAEWLAGRWVFYNLISNSYEKQDQAKIKPEVAAEKIMDIPETPTDFLRQAESPDSMTYLQLKDYIKKFSFATSGTMRKFRVGLAKKIAFPFMNLVMVILGAPFALGAIRSGALFGVGTVIFISLIYYALSSVCLALGNEGVLSPLLAAWLPNLLFSALGLIYIHSKQ
jgi:lipopolysaccharide export system permease protein